MKILSKLNTIQTKLNVPKNQHNKFGNFNYRSSEDILEAVKTLLQETKTVLTITDEVILIGERYYVKATATLKDAESGEEVSSTGWAREDESKKGMDSSQLTGSTSSYARKYALNGLLAIDDNKDADSMNNKKEEGKKSTNSDVNKRGELLSNILKIAESRKISPEMLTGLIKEDFNKENSTQLTMQELYALKRRIEG